MIDVLLVTVKHDS